MTPGTSIDEHDLPEAIRTASRPEGGDAGGTLAEARRAFEREYLIGRLEEHGWNISRTAEAIGLARESLSRKIRQHKIEVERG
jgi:two-component system nitrogen regulation response regulator NtrX